MSPVSILGREFQSKVHLLRHASYQGPVVRKPINANPRCVFHFDCRRFDSEYHLLQPEESLLYRFVQDASNGLWLVSSVTSGRCPYR